MKSVLYIAVFLLLAIGEGFSQCGNNNNYWTYLNPTGVGNTQTTNCIWGGEYVTVNVCQGASYTFSTCGSSWDTQITVYWSTGGAALAYNDDSCGLQSVVTWTATATGTVWVLVDRYDCTWGITCGILSVTQNTACSAPPPVNDPCSGAIAVTCPQTITGTTIGAAADAIPAGCYVTTGAAGLWYVFTGNGMNVTVSLCGSGYDTQLSVFNGSCTGLNCVQVNDDFCGAQSQLTFLAGSGITYYIYVFGWASDSGNFTLNISCATPPPPTNQDCLGAITICNDQSFGGNSGGEGNYVDLSPGNQDCLSLGENQTSWYVFSPLTPGTISFSINPIPLVDYDFAIYGPMSSVVCPPVGPPLRCSYSALYANTGIVNWATDNSEDAAGDAWVNYITVAAGDVGQFYIMVLDNFSVTTTPFTFDWTLNGVTLDCSILLPVELVNFHGEAMDNMNLLTWTTLSELNNDHFDVQRSTDAFQFETIARVEAGGNSSSALNYVFEDRDRPAGLSYYRLMQVDYNGLASIHETIAVTSSSGFSLVTIFPNPAEQTFTVLLYSDDEHLVELNVCDVTGRVAISQSYQLQKGSNSISLSSETLGSGFYTLHILTDGEKLVAEKVLKK